MNASFKHKAKFLMFPLIFLAFILAGGFAVMLLWNAILPDLITGVGKITYLHATGLLLLCRILFGGFKGRGQCSSGHGGGFGWREKMGNMTEEEREKFKAEWKERCGRK